MHSGQTILRQLHDIPEWFIKWAVAGIVSFWVSLPASFPILLLFMAMDFITGILAAFIRRTLHSGESFRGLAKKTLILLLVVSAHIAGIAAGIGVDIGAIVAIAYIVNEVISITENCHRAGIPIPGVLVEALVKARSAADWRGEKDRRKKVVTGVDQPPGAEAEP